jgi:hypothetical protein
VWVQTLEEVLETGKIDVPPYLQDFWMMRPAMFMNQPAQFS